MRPSQRLLAAFFVFAGTMHFVVPKRYEAIMPPYLPRHREAVAISGLAEIAGGLMVLHPRTRVFAGTWLVALLAAVFPANVHMALHPGEIRGLDADRVPRWALWARLPLQPLMMAWAWKATRPDDR